MAHLDDSEINRVFEQTWRAGNGGPGKLIELAENQIPISMKKYGVLCLTENRCNNVMFTHYAEAHKGFSIGLNSTRSFDWLVSRKTNGWVNRLPLKVDYVQEVPSRPSFFDDENYVFWIVKTKHSDWAYENEWRILNFAGEQSRVCHDLDITEVMLGCNMPESDRRTMCSLIAQSGMRPRVLQASRTSRKLALELNEVDVHRVTQV